MTAPVQAWTVDGDAWAGARPRLSVLIPFRGDDPRPLLQALEREAGAMKGKVEVVALDDGSGDDVLAAGVTEAVRRMTAPARFVRLAANEGRAKGRNRLARQARAGHLLFLDADMLPDSPDFLARYLALIDAEDPAVAFGGFSLPAGPADPAHALHRRLAGGSDTALAEVRRRHPEKHVFTSNLLIRRDVLEAEAFDEGFRGWGWEDVEWGIRVSRRHAIVHIDNTAAHLGLDAPAAIAAKYEQSAANFARVLAAHPEVVRGYPSYRAARLLKAVPLGGLWRPALKAVALSGLAPLPLRALCMKLYRAAVCARAL